MKHSRKLIPAIALLVLSVVLMTTATFAWFSMNSRVTVTGMQMETEAGDNVMIAANATKTKEATLTNFRNALVQTPSVAKLRPVSSVDGASFFYAKGLQVNGGGAASAPAGYDPYVAYDKSNVDSVTAFKKNYRRTSEAIVGYTEYAFQVMAVNAEGTVAKDLVIDSLALTYSGSTNVQKAFRVAVFADEFESDTLATETLVTILRPSGAEYFTTNSAVNGTTATSKAVVQKGNQPATLGKAVPAGATKFYRVVVRVWLEGEDTTCTNSTFANLDDTWSLDLSVSFKDSDHTPVTSLNGAVRNVELPANYVVGTAAQPIDTTLYYPILNGDAPVAVDGMTNAYLYTTSPAGTALTSVTDFYALTLDTVNSVYQYPVNVTPQYTVIPSVDLTAATLTEDGKVTIGTIDYYVITGATFKGQQLYSTATPTDGLASDSVVYTIADDVATDVTIWCKLPEPAVEP